jgi:hypothetical protein
MAPGSGARELRRSPELHVITTLSAPVSSPRYQLVFPDGLPAPTPLPPPPHNGHTVEHAVEHTVEHVVEHAVGHPADDEPVVMAPLDALTLLEAPDQSAGEPPAQVAGPASSQTRSATPPTGARKSRSRKQRPRRSPSQARPVPPKEES